MATNLGQTTLNGVLIISSNTTPVTGGLVAPVGSFCVAVDGSGIFYKFSSSNTSWSVSPNQTFVTPEMYGAVGDGSTNDSTALQNAINSGYAVYLGSKNYRITTGLTLTTTVKIFGNGKASIISTNSNITILNITGDYNTIENISLVGNSSGAAQTGISAIGVVGLTSYRLNNIVTNCYFFSLNYSGLLSQYMVGSSSGSKHEGSFLVSNCEYNVFSNCSVQNCTTGVVFTGGNNNFTGGQIVDNTTGVSLLSGTNDGHCNMSGTKINHNTTNISCSAILGYNFIGCQLYAGAITLTGTGKVMFIGCQISMSSQTLTITNSPVSFYSTEFVTVPSTYTLTGTAPLLFNCYNGTSRLLTPTTTTTSVLLESSNNLSDVATANTALNNLLPTQTINSGKFLTTNGTNSSWATISGGGDLLSANNLSDVASATTSRNNILPSKVNNALKVLRVNAAETDYEVATFAGGGDLLAANNLSDVVNPFTSRNNLKLWDMFLTNGDQPTSSNVATAITDLITPTLAINKRYYIDGYLHVGCNNTGGVKWQLTLPTGATMNLGYLGHTTSSGVFAQTVQNASATLGAAMCTVNSPNCYIRISGEITMSSTSGTAQFGFASGTNTQTSTVYQQGTYFNLKQLN